MKQYIRQLLLLCLLSLSFGMEAQEIVGPEGPDRPSLNQTITVTQSVGGTISPAGSGGQVVVATNSNQTFTVEAAEGYVIENVTVDGVPQSITAGLVTYPYTFTNIVADHTLTASFTATRFTLETEAGKGGTIVPATALVAKGGSQTFTITPATGYEIESLRVDGSQVKTASTYTFSNVEKGGKLSATFKAIEYAVHLSTLSHGVLEVKDAADKLIGDGDKVSYGTILNLTAQPEAGYVVDRMTANNQPVSGATWKVTGEVTLAASFQKALCKVKVESSEKGGVLTVKSGSTALLTGTHSVVYGTVLQLEAIPATGYTFGSFQVEPAGMFDSGSAQVTVTGDVGIGVKFAPVKYQLTVTKPATTEGVLTVNGQVAATGEYEYGAELQLGNIPAAGKVFDAYRVTPASTLTGHRIKMTEDVTLTATFKEAPADGGSEAEGYPVTFAAPLIVKEGDRNIVSGDKVKKGTSLTLLVSNTNIRRLVSLTAGGNPVDFLTMGGLNTAVYPVTSAVVFAAAFADNRHSVHIETPEGGTLKAQTAQTPVVSGGEYLYGTVLTVDAVPAEGYKLTRIQAGMHNITTSKRVTLTEDLVLSAVFTKEGDINTQPDPENPDPNAPAGIDLTPQQVVYNGKEQAFRLISVPGGIVDKVAITYSLNGKNVQPVATGLYNVRLVRAADERFAAFDQTVTGGLEIRRAPVTILSVDYEEEQLVGSLVSTIATMKGGKAEAQGKAVAGRFAWVSSQASGDQLTVTASGYQQVRFTPTEAANYLEATAQVYIKVGDIPEPTYTVSLSKEGEGSVALYNGDQPCDANTLFYGGMSLSLQSTPAEGFRVEGYRIEGTLYNANPYTLTVTNDVIAVAVFKKKADPTDPSGPNPVEVTLTPPVSVIYDGKPKLVGVSSSPSLSGWQVTYYDEQGKAVIPVNAGTYRITVSREEDDTYQAYNRTTSFTVSKAMPVIRNLSVAGAIPLGAPLEDAVLEGGVASVDGIGIVPGTFEWMEPAKTVEREELQTVRFVPTDRVNFFGVTAEITVPVVTYTVPVCVTYSQSSGGMLTVTYDRDGAPLASGTLIPSGTAIRIQVKAASYFTLESLQIGTADYTFSAVSGHGTVVREMYTSKEIKASFIRTSNPPGPDPDPDPDPNPGTDPNPDPDPDPNPDPDPGYTEHTVWVRTTGLGSVSPETSRVEHGGSLSFDITPGYGQQLVDVRLNGNSVGAVSNYKLTAIGQDATIEAVFSHPGIPVYTLTSRVVGKEGYVTPTSVRVSKGSNHRFIIQTTGKGKREDVQVGTPQQLKSIGTPGSYIFREVKADSLLVAVFSIATSNEWIIADNETAELYASGNSLYVRTEALTSTLRVYTLDGRLLTAKKLTAGSFVQWLPEGLYIAEWSEGKHIVKKKIRIGR